jgi:hypothetical protein
MTEQKHPLMTAIEATHGDVKALHPLLDLLNQEADGEDPLMILADLLARIEIRLLAIEAALSLPHSTEPVEL